MSTLVDGRWQAGLGDPTLLGWVTVGAYAVTAFMAWSQWRHEVAHRQDPNNRLVASWRGRGGHAAPAPWFWLMLTLILAFLCLNKQLDLQSWFTEVARDHAKAHGWYERRGQFQVGFIQALGVLVPVVLLLLLARLRPFDAARGVALTGLVVLSAFVLMRAASFHGVDTLLQSEWLGMRLNGWLELSAIGLIAWGAWLGQRKLAAPSKLSMPSARAPSRSDARRPRDAGLTIFRASLL